MATTTYLCPMHPEVRQDQPGYCPHCGMSLVPESGKPRAKTHAGNNTPAGHGKHMGHAAADAGYDKHAGHSTVAFRNKFFVCLGLTLPVLFFAPILDELFGFQAPAFPGSALIPPVFATGIFFYGGWVFLASAWRELRAKRPGMMTLIALAISVAYFYSIGVTITGGEETLYWELSTLITIMLLGHWLEMRSVSGAQSALKELSKLLPDTAEVLRDGGQTETVPLEHVKANDRVLVKPGAKIPTDGEVEDGESEVNEAIATGESKPVAKHKGSAVIAGTVNGDGTLTVRVTKIGEETFLAGVQRLVREAQSSKSRLQMLSDRAAFALTIIAVVVGGITFVVWLALDTPAFAIERAVAVLVITCPHALGLAIPLVAAISTTKAARSGFLVKQRLALEAARSIQVVLFDKTGTLTTGQFGVDAVVPASADTSEENVLALAASVNAKSEHPIAQAIVAAAKKDKLKFGEVSDFQRLPGKGAQASLGGKTVQVGSPRLLEESGAALEGETKRRVDELSAQGKTVIFVMADGKLIGAIALADQIREESREAVAALREAEIETAMITGDSEDVAKWVAGELGIDTFFAKVLPEKKSEKVKELQAKGKRVAMVGDGVNDAPALTQADLGIAIGAGTTVAIESAGIILVKNDPRDIPRIIRLSQLTYRKMLQNLFWATGYNVVAIPLAAGVLAAQGIFLQPALAALFMSLSTVIVAVNAVLLRGKSMD